MYIDAKLKRWGNSVINEKFLKERSGHASY